MNPAPDDLDAAAALGTILDDLGVPYYVGGSLASSVHGDPRSTNDVDLAAELDLPGARALVAALDPRAWVVVEESLLEAVRSRRSTSLHYLPAASTIDLYVCPSSAFDRSSMDRRVRISPRPDVSFFVSSPEDTVVRKLLWYRKGGEVSDRQWKDVLGMLQLGGDSLDRDYLDRWARTTGVGDLLEEARLDVLEPGGSRP